MNIKNFVSRILNVKFDFPIQEVEAEGVYVKFDSAGAIVGGCSKPALARGYMLLAKGISESKPSFEIVQKAHFEDCGVMVCASAGVLHVKGMKEYLDYMAIHGMNVVMLYTEDTYEVEGYPHLGYQQGRYSLKELKEIDDYAASLGIEVIPCIQTLGHMGKFLRYNVNSRIAENDQVLLPGEDATYEFIEACIATMRKAFRSKRIHIGCDETRGLGFGKYFKLHGYQDRFQIFNDHVSKVVEISKKYEFHPMMWSDMYFSMAAPVGAGDFGIDVQVPQYVIAAMPDCDMVFWDYYHDYNDFYGANIQKHKMFQRKTWFAGGIWSWTGHAPNIRYTYETVKPAMEECIKHGVKSVLGTSWGGGPSHILALPCLAMYSEYCWRGADCTREEIYGIAQFVTKVSYELSEAISDFHCGLPNAHNYGRMIFWSDPLVNLLCYKIDLNLAEKCYVRALNVFEKYPDAPYVDYYKSVFRAVLQKVYLHQNLRKKYKEDDREWLAVFANETIPEMQKNFETVYELSDELWHKYCKTQNFEKYSVYYAGAIERIRYTGKQIHRYLAGEIAEIEALEPEILQGEAQEWVPLEGVMHG